MDEWLPEAQPDYEAFDLTYAEWYEECDVECDAMIAAVHEAHDCSSYVQASHLESHAGLDGMYEIVLDSGADVSVMPFDWEALGSVDHDMSLNPAQLELRDAQGASMPHQGAKVLELDVGDMVIPEKFVVTSVGAPLLALGKMFRQGWKLDHDGDGHSWLINGESYPCVVPKEHSLHLSLCPPSSCPGQRREHGEIKNFILPQAAIRHVAVELQFGISKLTQGWQFTEEEGLPVHLGLGSNYMDPSTMMNVSLWKCRATLV